ncbi:MAG: MATE family efflux transporter [Deltaproteobacteria bacterium]|nr:MATE family efflux transporter [Deltaproteobacteria bacterium]
MNEQEFGTAPILKLFFRCTVPAMVGMGFSAIYSVTDGIFVGRFIGQEALAAVNLVMPPIMIITALSDMIATGSSVRISILLGQDDSVEASRVFSVCLACITTVSSILGMAGFVLAQSLVGLMGADGTTAECAVEYLRIFSLFMPLCSIYYSTDNYLRVCGKVHLSMTINIVCSLLNIVLDLLLIVVLKQGLWSAAVASCASMSLGAVWSLIPFVRKQLPLMFTRGKIAARQMVTILTNGSSEFFVSIAGSLFAVVINVVLLGLDGATAVAAAAIVEYVESITGMVLHSMTDALQPAISYCFGAGLLRRMKKILGVMMGTSAFLSLLAMLFLLFGGKLLLPFFIKEGDAALYNVSLRALQLYALSYLVNWIDGTLSGYMTAVERPWHSLAISLLGTFIYPLLFLVILVPILQLDGIWILPFVAGIFSAATAIIIAGKARIQNAARPQLHLLHSPMVSFQYRRNGMKWK